MTFPGKMLIAGIGLTLSSLPAIADPQPGLPISPATIDQTVADAMAAFDVPGVAVGIVKDGKLVFAKGYGVREAGKPDAVDPQTLFQIGSNTKAFTAAALSLLVDEGKIGWDDKVIDHLPQFRLADPYVTREFTVRDLLTHRSGLGPGAGDLMFFPVTDMSRAEIIHGLQYLKPVSGFRSRFDYDNLFYMVAGELVASVSGQPWEDFVDKRILHPLRMSGCTTNGSRIPSGANVAHPHALVDGVLRPIPATDLSVVAAAGSISCNIDGIAAWLETQLAGGIAPDGTRLFSADRSADMWTMNTIRANDALRASAYRTHFSGYGLGWFTEDMLGYKRVWHTGGVPGTVTWITMVPELNLGVIVLTNQQSGSAMEAIGNQIVDAYVGAPARNWVAMTKADARRQAAAAAAAKDTVARIAEKAQASSLPLAAFAGSYVDPWRGVATVRQEGSHLVLKFSRTAELEGMLTPYGGDVFVVRWNNRSLNADALVRFEEGFDRKVSRMTMRAISPETDFSFDFQDLDFKKMSSPATRG